MISLTEYEKLMDLMMEMAAKQEADQKRIDDLEETVAYLRESLENDYVPKAVYQEDLMILREQQSFIGENLGTLTGLTTAEALNESSLGKRMNMIETDHRKIDRLMEGMNDLLHETVMEFKNGKNPFKPNAPSVLERLEQKKADAIRLMR